MPVAVRRRRASMLAAVLACAAALLVAASGSASRCRAQSPAAQMPSYILSARLDPDAHVVTGHERIRWRNGATVPAAELWFHLYLNAFASDDTVFMRETGGISRGVGCTGRGRILVTSLRIAGGPDLLPDADTEVIDGDATQMRVPLPSPIPSGGWIDLEIGFRSELPPICARAGYHEGFHAVAQWYPKLAVRERDGTWATFPYHGRGEFFADFARYDLAIDTPVDVVIGATGELVDEVRSADRITRRYSAARVHDAVFFAWDQFRERRLDVGGTHVRILYPPGYESAVARHAAVVREGLAHYGALFGAYPWPTLTVIVPPRGAEGAAGMEYPTLIVTGGTWFIPPGVNLGVGEDVTAHELGHQWFQGVVANNEVMWPMLDEGLTQWATGELLRHMHGTNRSGLSCGGVHADVFQLMRVWSIRWGPPLTPPARPAYDFSESELGRSVYARTALVIETIGRVWGRQRLIEALSLYVRRQRFHHPEPADLYAAFDEVYWAGFSRAVLEPALDHGADAAMHIETLSSSREHGRWVTKLDARRDGALSLPTSVVLVEESGRRTRIVWPTSERRLKTAHSGRGRTVTAILDPEHHNLLDPSLSDNVRHLGPPAGDDGLFSRLLFLAQQLFAMVGP